MAKIEINISTKEIRRLLSNQGYMFKEKITEELQKIKEANK